MDSSKHLITHSTAIFSRSFNPRSISNCTLWLCADKDLYTDTGLTTPVSADAALVAGWKDRSTSANNFTQATEANRPAYKVNIVNGRSVVRFDGIASFLTGTARIFVTDHFSLFVVAKGAISAGAAMLTQSTGGAGRSLVGIGSVSPYNSLRLFFNNGSTRNMEGKTVCWDNANFNLLYLDGDDSGNYYSRINGAVEYEALTGQAWTPSNVAALLGVYYGSANWWGGDIAEIIFYTRKLSAAERKQVEAYLARKFNLPSFSGWTTNAYAAGTITPDAAAITTPTYDTSGEAVHPSVYDAGSGNTWNSHRYWMAMTPYPNSNQALENPSILYSDDGETWAVPDGLTNPLDTPAADWHYADTELVMVGTPLYCVWLAAKTGVNDKLYESHSTDGVTWSVKTEILDAPNVRSPAILWDNTQYVMYCMNSSGSPYVLQRRTAAAVTGPWSDPINCSFYRGDTGILWHLDVIKVGTALVAVLCQNGTSGTWVAVSYDGLHWQLSGKKQAGGTWDAITYRGTISYNGTDLDFWYSANNNGSPTKVWGTGKTSITGLTFA